jgi:hypothetical protein
MYPEDRTNFSHRKQAGSQLQELKARTKEGKKGRAGELWNGERHSVGQFDCNQK